MGPRRVVRSRGMAMTERLTLQGRITATVTTPSGDIVGEWTSSNTACYAGLDSLVSMIAYEGVQDIAATIGATSPAIITPIYGAIGGPSSSVSINSSTTSGNAVISPQLAGTFASTLVNATVTDADFYVSSGTTVVSVASDGSSIVLSSTPTTTTSSDLLTFTPLSGSVVTQYCALDSTTTTVTPQVINAFSTVPVGSVVSGLGIPSGATVTVVGSDYSYVQVSSFTLPTVTSSSNVLAFSPPGPTVISCNVTSGSATITPNAGGTPFSNIGVGWSVSDVAGILTGLTVASIGPGFASVTLSATAGSSYTGDSVIFSPGTPGPTDTSLYNELANGTGRATATSQGSVPASVSSSTNATFTWQFQFPINNTGSTITVSEAGVFLLATGTINVGNLLNHALLNPAASWGNGQMLTLSVSIGLSP